MNEITIVHSATQRKYIISSSATTLAELKKDLDTHGISYGSMTFLEALTKTELKSDESLLPKDVPYKGAITNNLVFLLTATKSKISSGASVRDEIIAQIKSLGLQDKVKEKYGKNFTNCKSENLLVLIEEAKKSMTKLSSKEQPTVEEEVLVVKDTPKQEEKLIEDVSIQDQINNLYTIVNNIVNKLINSDIFDGADKAEIYEDLTNSPIVDQCTKKTAIYSEEELNDLLNF